MATLAGANVVVIDCLKDAALGLTSDEGGAAINRAIQSCLVNAVNVVVLHHQTKSSGLGDGGNPISQADG